MSSPLARAFLQAELGNRYSKVMEGIGRVTTAVSQAEFRVDVIGWYLTGDLDAYHILTKGMATGSKTSRIKEMGKALIRNKPIKDRLIRFCDSLLKFLEARNDAVHSFHAQFGGHIVRLKFTSHRKPLRLVTSEELFKLADEIWNLAGEDAELVDDIEKALRARREAPTVTQISNPDAATLSP